MLYSRECFIVQKRMLYSRWTTTFCTALLIDFLNSWEQIYSEDLYLQKMDLFKRFYAVTELTRYCKILKRLIKFILEVRIFSCTYFRNFKILKAFVFCTQPLPATLFLSSFEQISYHYSFISFNSLLN